MVEEGTEALTDSERMEALEWFRAAQRLTERGIIVHIVNLEEETEEE